MKFYCEDKEHVLAEVAGSEEGLRSEEAAARLEKNGKNKLVEGKKESLFRRFLKQLAEPMTIILLVAAAISGVLAEQYGGNSNLSAQIVFLSSLLCILTIPLVALLP